MAASPRKSWHSFCPPTKVGPFDSDDCIVPFTWELHWKHAHSLNVVQDYNASTQKHPKFKASLGYIVSPCLRKQRLKYTSIVEQLPNVYKALDPIPSTTKELPSLRLYHLKHRTNIWWVPQLPVVNAAKVMGWCGHPELSRAYQNMIGLGPYPHQQGAPSVFCTTRGATCFHPPIYIV